MDSIYLDHNATTPIHLEVAQAMARCHAEGLANPASGHRPGQRARKLLEDAREQIAERLGADLSGPRPDRLIFTGTATEANNLAVLGIARAAPNRPARIVVSAIEHASVMQPAEHLLEEGWRLDTLGVTLQGVVRSELLADLLTDRTCMVSVILGNHETGVLQPVAELARRCNDAGVPMHTDAAQVVGKLPVDFRRLGTAAMSLSAHKFSGPLGIASLLVRHGVPIEPLIFGGPHQWALRPGTESVALAVGMSTALELWHKEHQQLARRMTDLRRRFESGLKAGFPDLIVHGATADRLPQTANVAFAGLDGQVLLLALDAAGVACSVGAACSSGSTELSPTLRAMGLPGDIVTASLRFSLGATTTEAQIDEALRRILHVCNELRG